MTLATVSTLEHTIGSDGLLEIRFASGDVRLKAIDGEMVRVRDRRDHDIAEMFEVELGTGSLSLRSDPSRDMFSGRRRRHTPDLDVEVPRGATVVIESASGEIVGDGLVGDQRFRSASGDITLRAGAGRIEVDAVSGDIHLVTNGTATLSARTVSGDLEVRASTLPSLRASTTSGDLKIAGRLEGAGPFTIETVSGDALLAPAGDARIEMTSITGDLRSELLGRSEGGRGRRTLVLGSGQPTVTFRSMSGDLRIVRPQPVQGSAEQRPDEIESETRATLVLPDPAPAERLTNGALAAAYDDARLRILRALERGEIDVAEADIRLEALDLGSPEDESTPEVEPTEPIDATDTPEAADTTDTETTRTPTDG